MPVAEMGAVALAIVVMVASYFTITGAQAGDRQLSPVMLALLLLANLFPVVLILMLLGRRIAKRRAAQMLAEGGGQMHVRLVAIFSLLASVPIVLTVIAASIIIQSGTQFWVSERARHAFEASMDMVRDSQKKIIDRWVVEGSVMAGDLERESGDLQIGSREFHEYFERNAYWRNLKQAVLFSYTKNNGVNVYDYWQSPDVQQGPSGDLLKTVFASRITPKLLDFVHRRNQAYFGLTNDTLWVVYEVKGIKNSYLYVGTTVDADFLKRQVVEAQTILNEHKKLQERARALQVKFSLALFAVALLIMIVTVWIALAVADRLVRPLNQLVAAAGRAAEGDLSARVPEPETRDEVGTLASAFNSMTERLQQQTSALENRRALIEAVMSGVSAGVIAVARDRSVRLMNESASALLKLVEEIPVGRPLADVAPELDAFLDEGQHEGIVQLSVRGETRTLAVTVTGDELGQVLTFDDITQQLLDQRRAAWSDVARRIAHEIKNPLTPIQLAAERLQRRYGKQIDPTDTTFARLTDTIVRQVADLRRMVDEFSSFARMPKPVFREESLLDLARQAIFLHEVAHPTIRFSLDHPDPTPNLVCDRRQIGQALTNVVKNAVEAIEARAEGAPEGEVAMAIRSDGDRLTLEVSDNGVGLPVERDRIVEPYMTTRSRGTGLGLAIVKKIVEEHFGTIGFVDRPGGGTIVTFCFEPALLASFAAAAKEESREDRPSQLTRTGNKA
jgi:two-component system nitrogen regulation sensor histidine kinase NtrY